MSAKILDGKNLAETLRGEIRARVLRLKERGITPGLGVILVGNDPASRSYVTGKERACSETGLLSVERHLPASASREEILGTVRAFNDDPAIHGILVQLPLPDSSMEREILETVDPDKDVDGFHPVNVGRMLLGLPSFWPCTPHGVLQILSRSGIPISGAHAVIIGRSHIVGRPLANLMSLKGPLGDATVTICHTRTRHLAEHTRMADIVIAAAGRPNTLSAKMIREGATVIDVGVNRIADPTRKSGMRLVGDVAFDEVREKAGAVTPVPGGVGPMTITLLLQNTVEAAERLAASRTGGPPCAS
ncbi:MAG: tetrahydrofolate dehydrogenase/cyclohydrolase catalytic domain-containing protein [Kiritimatiellia bacterium]|nr:tetrahydrofolate dehydrogenase/cyclohydrolase catalytic domain-containing protein [Kiritimatiellia bacterium]